VPGVSARAGTPAEAEPARAVVESAPLLPAVEADRVVPPSGNLQIGGQQVWLGRRWRAGRSPSGRTSGSCTCCWTGPG
jgi:hypothetical protein